MALRVLRTTLTQAGRLRCISSIRSNHLGQSPCYQVSLFQERNEFQKPLYSNNFMQHQQTRDFSTKTNEDDTNEAPTKPTHQPILVYESPFAALTLKLKRVSLTSAAIGIIGLPALSLFYGAQAGVPPTGQLAVIATAGVTAVGSTALLGYCFSPYVHTLEILPENVANGECDDKSERQVRMVTRDILARRVETIFNPSADVSPPSKNTRPFCNFMVRDQPFYIHPDLVQDNILRRELVGDEGEAKVDDGEKKKVDDDEFL